MDEVMRVVSAAVIREDSGVKRLLLAQRRAGGSDPFAWCTLGGKEEEGESPVEALVRNLGEELIGLSADWDLNVAWTLLFSHEGTNATTGQRFRLTCLTTRLVSSRVFDDVMPGDGFIGVGWFTAHEVATLHLAAADDANRTKLVEVIR